MSKRILMILVTLDCLALSILKFGNHYRGATISAACWELEQQGKRRGRVFRPLIDLLFRPIEPDHCASEWLQETYLRKGNP